MFKKTQSSARTAVLMTVVLAAMATAVHAEDVPLANGKLWMESSNVEKKSYIVGVSNLMVIEYLYQEGSKKTPTDDQTLIQRFFKHSEGVTLDGIIQRIDRWYQTHPDQMDEIVIAVIWKELIKE